MTHLAKPFTQLALTTLLLKGDIVDSRNFDENNLFTFFFA